MNKRLFSPIEAGDYLGFSKAHIWNLIRDGKIQSKKIGVSRRIEKSELDRFIEENSQAA